MQAFVDIGYIGSYHSPVAPRTLPGYTYTPDQELEKQSDLK